MTSPRGWRTKQKAQLKTIVSIFFFFAPMILEKEIVIFCIFKRIKFEDTSIHLILL
jgi:hypothetical protein